MAFAKSVLGDLEGELVKALGARAWAVLAHPLVLDSLDTVAGWRQGCYGPWMEPHPWLKPLSRRVGVTIACLAWLGFEAYHDPGGLWFWLALGATAYAIWDFFLSGSYRGAPE